MSTLTGSHRGVTEHEFIAHNDCQLGGSLGESSPCLEARVGDSELKSMVLERDSTLIENVHYLRLNARNASDITPGKDP